MGKLKPLDLRLTPGAYTLTPPPSPMVESRRASRVGSCVILAGVLVLLAIGAVSHPASREAGTRLLPCVGTLSTRLTDEVRSLPSEQGDGSWLHLHTTRPSTRC